MAGIDSKSKRPSDLSSNSKPPETLTFFLDRALGKRRIADGLRALGLAVEVHEDHYPSDATDVEWLSDIGKKGWVVLTKDSQIRYRAPERQALLNAGVAAFVLTSGNLTGDEMKQVFITAMPRIMKLLNRQQRPFIAKVTRSGIVTLLIAPRQRRGTRR